MPLFKETEYKKKEAESLWCTLSTTRCHNFSKVMSLQQGWHAIMRNKWKAVQILRGKDTTNTALRLKGFSFSSLGFTSLNIYLAFRYLYIFFGFLIHGTEQLGIVRACSNVTAHMCQTECGGDSSFRSSLWHQIQDCRQHGDPYFFRVQFIQKKNPFLSPFFRMFS